jgi:hypothetical protein
MIGKKKPRLDTHDKPGRSTPMTRGYVCMQGSTVSVKGKRISRDAISRGPRGTWASRRRDSRRGSPAVLLPKLVLREPADHGRARLRERTRWFGSLRPERYRGHAGRIGSHVRPIIEERDHV